jgi:hypothetical protein
MRKLDSKIINITNCKTWIKWLLDINDVILIRYYCQPATSNALNESTDSSTGQPADNPPNPEVLGNFPCNLPVLLVWAYWQPGSWVLSQFISDLDADPIWQSWTIANTLYWYGYLNMKASLLPQYLVERSVQCALKCSGNGAGLENW